MKKIMIFTLLTFLAANSNSFGSCKAGDQAIVIWAGSQYHDPYKFTSYADGTSRILPIGTKLVILNATYVGIALTDLTVAVSSTRNLADPKTGEMLSCEPVIKENGQFKHPSQSYFEVNFVSCQQ